MSIDNELRPEFSVEVDLSAFGRGEKSFILAANDAERRKIAVRLGALSVEKLEGNLRLAVAKTEIYVHGHVCAALTRECVSSLAPVDEIIDEPFEIEFVRHRPAPADDITSENDEESWRLPEVHEDEIFDLGELLIQQLALCLDPYPRKKGAPSLAEQYGRDGEASPFAVLSGAFGKNEENQ